MPSWQTPTDAQISSALQRMRSPDFEAYFFTRLENPAWVVPLAMRGVFAGPPKPIVDEDGRTLFPIWQASRYLVRMAAEVPADVAAALERLDVSNPHLAADVVDAALSMPAAIARTLVPTVARAARAGTLSLHTMKAGELVGHLAEGGEIDAALSLAEALFQPHVSGGSEELLGRDLYWYERSLNQALPHLIRSRPVPSLHALCRWLTAALDAKPKVDRETGADYSYWWRQAIKEHAQNDESDFAGKLVGFVREGFEMAISEGGVPLRDALRIIEHRRYLVFRRLKVHLVDLFAEHDEDLARAIMMDRGHFSDFRFKHEYAHLLGHRFALLSSKQQEEWLGWVWSGPESDELDGLEGADRTARADYWRFTRFHWVRAHLTDREAEFYEGMLATHGEPELADLHWRVSTGSWGSISPVDLEEWDGQSLGEVVAFLRSWQPTEHRHFGPDIQGLADTFGSYVSSAPQEFAKQADLLVDCDPIYVRTFIREVTAAVEAGHDIEIGDVLSLAAWVLSRPSGEPAASGEGSDPLTDRDWQWTRDQIAELVKAVCRVRVGDRPKYDLELREGLWSILSDLYGDPAPSYLSSDRDAEDPRTRDYLTPAINSSRGKAVGACLEYARWVATQSKQASGDKEVIPGGFDVLPEVRGMLEWQLAPENRTPEALAIIGLHVGLLFWIDREWLEGNAPRLFALGNGDESQRNDCGWAAWNTFLNWVNPHYEYYRLFQTQFAEAIRESSEILAQESAREGPMEHLGEHLMVLYARGQLSLEEGSIVREFLSQTSPLLRRYAIGFVGRILWREAGLTGEVVERLMALWDYYWSGPGPGDSGEQPSAWLFGPWFASKLLPPNWALERLTSYVKIVGVPEPDHAVVDRLAEIASVDLVASVSVLDRMVHEDREGWRIHGWRKPAGRVLRQAIAAGGQPRVLAEATLDFLGRRGFPDFVADPAGG